MRADLLRTARFSVEAECGREGRQGRAAARRLSHRTRSDRLAEAARRYCIEACIVAVRWPAGPGARRGPLRPRDRRRRREALDTPVPSLPGLGGGAVAAGVLVAPHVRGRTG